MIVKVQGTKATYELKSKKTGRRLGRGSKGAMRKREKQVEMFKHMEKKGR